MSWMDALFENARAGVTAPDPEQQAPAERPTLGSRIKEKVESLWVAVSNPSGADGDLGVAEPAYYRASADGETMILCDVWGDDVGQVIKIKPGETARQVAARMKKREWADNMAASDFNRPLRYQNVKFNTPC
jgi:hypothetical protein